MCIRDSLKNSVEPALAFGVQKVIAETPGAVAKRLTDFFSCLLYTSDAADERSSVDLGGRRIIKKKKRGVSGGLTIQQSENSSYVDATV